MPKVESLFYSRYKKNLPGPPIKRICCGGKSSKDINDYDSSLGFMASFQGFLIDFDLASLKVNASGITLASAARICRVRLHTC